MKWIQVGIGPVAARVAPLLGRVAECPDCGSREWYVFQLVVSRRPYLQCAKCDRVETADGEPSAELSMYALADQAGDDVLHPMTMRGREVGG